MSRELKEIEYNQVPQTRSLFEIIKPKWWVVIFVGLVVCGLVFVPFSYAEYEHDNEHYKTVYTETDELELGESRIDEYGVSGAKVHTYKVTKSLLDHLLQREGQRIKTNTTVRSEPVDQLVVKGTRRWQYMYCSNGSYRLYTDEQMKNKNIGFTSKSQDYCKENGQGTKTKLADTAPQTPRYTSTYAPTPTLSLPYSTPYQYQPIDMSALEYKEIPFVLPTLQQYEGSKPRKIEQGPDLPPNCSIVNNQLQCY